MTIAKIPATHDSPVSLPHRNRVETVRSIDWSMNALAFVAICTLVGIALWVAGDVILLIFTGLLLALLLVNLSGLVKKKTQLTYSWSLAVVAMVVTQRFYVEDYLVDSLASGEE